MQISQSTERWLPYGKMSEETLETLVKKALEESEESCTFVFQGGEPTLAGL